MRSQQPPPPGAEDGSARQMVTQSLEAGKEPAEIVEHLMANGWPDDKAWDLVYTVRDRTRRTQADEHGGGVPGGSHLPYDQSTAPVGGAPVQPRRQASSSSGDGGGAGIIGFILVFGGINFLSYVFNWGFWIY